MDNTGIEELRKANRVRGRHHEIARQLGLTGARMAALAELARIGGCGTATELAEGLGTSRQAVQRILTAMAGQGLVAIKTTEDDRRHRIATLEPAGREILEQAQQRADEPRRESTALETAFRAETASTRPAKRQSSTTPRSFELVRNFLLQKIREGELNPGDKLPPERDLGVQLGVGRPVVREALRSLEMAGVIRIERGSRGGAFVRESSSDGIRDSIDAMLVVGRLSLHDLMEMRSMLAAQSVLLGVTRGTEEDLARIEDSIDRLADAISGGDHVPGVTPAVDFYRMIARASHNPILILIMDAIASLIEGIFFSLDDWPHIDSVPPRRAILRAMRERKGILASRLVHEHAEFSRSVLEGSEDRLT